MRKMNSLIQALLNGTCHATVPTACSRSIWTVNRSADGAVLVAKLARRPMIWKDVFFRRYWNEEPYVLGPRRPYGPFCRCLRRQPRQPIRPIPETV